METTSRAIVCGIAITALAWTAAVLLASPGMNFGPVLLALAAGVGAGTAGCLLMQRLEANTERTPPVGFRGGHELSYRGRNVSSPCHVAAQFDGDPLLGRLVRAAEAFVLQDLANRSVDGFCVTDPMGVFMATTRRLGGPSDASWLLTVRDRSRAGAASETRIPEVKVVRRPAVIAAVVTVKRGRVRIEELHVQDAAFIGAYALDAWGQYRRSLAHVIAKVSLLPDAHGWRVELRVPGAQGDALRLGTQALRERLSALRVPMDVEVVNATPAAPAASTK